MVNETEPTDLQAKALGALRQAFTDTADAEYEQEIRTAATPTFVAELLRIAWRHQFDEDDSALKREMKRMIRETAEDRSDED